MRELAYIICKNCSNKPEGKYCSNCGQKTSVNRLTWKALFHYIPHALLHLDEGFFYTIKELMARPGHTIREYLQGKRVKHYNPLVMLVLLDGFASYLYVHFHIQTIPGAVKLDKVEAGNAMIAHKFFAARTIFFCLVCGIGDYLFFMERNIPFRKCCFQIFLFFGITFL